MSHPIFAAVYTRLLRPLEAGPIGEARRDLLVKAHGVVVDLGAGSGVNLTHLGDSVTAVHLVEPDPNMIRRMPRPLPAYATVHQAPAENVPLPDNCADTVLATLMLCSVTDQSAVAAEIRRVLRPGGRLLVLEHVRSADHRIARWQDLLRRPWGWFGGGCNPNRDTAAVLASAGFGTAGLTRFQAPGGPLTREWITGAVATN